LDEKKIAVGISPNQSVAASHLIQWINELSQNIENKALFSREGELRHVMNGFVEHHPLMVGDVVTIPKFVPHALQHGVRVIEFQTPVYERKILSFTQKVLTQTHWDTEDALGIVDMDFAPLQPPECLIDAPQLLVERIVNFEDFEVRRIQLDGTYLLSSNYYSVLIVVQGSLSLNTAGKTNYFEAGQALLIPKTENNWSISSAAPCIFLLASPH
jgi:mannose-6-phosphate isomerase class I